MQTPNRPNGAVWDRLRSNRQANAPIFLAAGQRPELARELECTACGASESALFWTVERSRPRELELRCPICEEGVMPYRFAGGRARQVRVAAVAMGAAVVLAATGSVVLALETDEAEREARREKLGEMYENGLDRVVNLGWSLVGLFPGVDPPPPRAARARASTPRGASQPVQLARPMTEPAREDRSARPTQRTSSLSETASVATAGETAASYALVFQARGDRREQLDLFSAQIIERSGTTESALLLQVSYDSIADETRVTVAPTSTEWPQRLTRLRGWRRLEQ